MEGVFGSAEIFARDMPIFSRIYLKGPHDLHSYRPSWSGPGLSLSMVRSGGHLSHGCGVPEEVLGWAEKNSRDFPVFGCRCLEGPHNLQI